MNLRPLWVLSPGDYRQAGDHRQLSTINGTLPPCRWCQEAMDEFAEETGARLLYEWPDGLDIFDP
jgi:hypothetical protein